MAEGKHAESGLSRTKRKLGKSFFKIYYYIFKKCYIFDEIKFQEL